MVKKFINISLIFIVLLSAFIGSGFFYSKSNEHNVLYIAHRGHGFYENTELSFRNSSNYYGIETDVKVTKDGVFVLNHDSSVMFADNTEYEIHNTNYEVLLTNKLVGGYKLCRLEDFLQICKEMDKQAIIELKVQLTLEQVTNFLKIINEYYTEEKCSVISFYVENLLNIKKESNMDLMLLFGENKEKNLEFCINNRIWPSCYYELITKEDIELIHQNGLKFGAWTVNDKFENMKLKLLGVDFITSDKFYK